jgi:DNA recombination-dependent growth factor C
MTRYRVEGKLKKPVLETVASGLKEHAIPAIDSNASEKTVGWTSFETPFQPNFDRTSFVFGAYFVFSLRIDKKIIPAKLLNKHCAMEGAKRLSESGRPYLTRDEKNAIREHVAHVLNMRIPATPYIYDMVWSYEERFVWFFSTVKTANEELETLFLKSFQLPLIRLFPYTTADLAMGLSDRQRDILLKLSVTDFTE